MSAAIGRAQSYYLVCAVVSKTTAYIVGPTLLRSEQEDNRGQATEQDQNLQGPSGNERANANGESDIEQLNERSSLLHRQASAIHHRATKQVKHLGHNMSSYFPDRVKQELMATFGSPFADVAILAALSGAFLGLVPPLHKAFFNPVHKGGIFSASITASVRNIGVLFTTFQIFVVGCTLGISFERMKASMDSGRVPIRAILAVFCARFVMWPM